MLKCGSQESVQLYVRSSVLLWSDGGDGEDGRCRRRQRHRGDVGGGGQISAEKELGRRKVKEDKWNSLEWFTDMVSIIR